MTIPEERSYDGGRESQHSEDSSTNLSSSSAVEDDEDSDVLPTAAWVEKQLVNDNEDVVHEQMREELFVEAQTFDSVDVFMDDWETVVVSTESFTGSHCVDVDRNGETRVSEVGWYTHDETDWEMEIGCPMDANRVQDVARKHRNSEPSGSAALTVGERNPQLGNNRL